MADAKGGSAAKDKQAAEAAKKKADAEKKAASSKKPKSMLSRLKAASSKVIQMQRFNWNTDLLRSSFMPDAGDFMALTNALKTLSLIHI